MSIHTGVSCDSCMKQNFPGRRYKCLLCDNYDLCGPCYDRKAESQNHKNVHPMQCILTEEACELFYAGEATRRAAVSLTCPHCGLFGFIPRTLIVHCMEKHPPDASDPKAIKNIMCPICVTSAARRGRNRFSTLAEHLILAHDDEAGGDEDSIQSPLLISKPRPNQNTHDDSDEDDEDDEVSINDIENRIFVEEEQRRQEIARQRLSHASSLAAALRQEYTLGSRGAGNSVRRSFIRQTTLRGVRGALRGVNRDSSGASSNSSSRGLHNGSSRISSQYTTTTDSNSNSFGAQDSMFEFVSRLINSQSTTASPSNQTQTNSFLLSPSLSTDSSSAISRANELARLHQLVENGEPVSWTRTADLSSKQKQSSQTDQQQQTSSWPSEMLTYPFGNDHPMGQQNFASQSATSNPSFSSGMLPNSLTVGNMSFISRSSQQTNREHNPRSLLGKILRSDHGSKKGESNENRAHESQNHVSFIQSVLLSSIASDNSNEDTNKGESVLNKENLC